MITTIKNPSNEKLDFDYQPPTDPAKRDWTFVLGHGVTGNMDRPLIVDAARILNQAGYATLRFSFAGNGNSEGRFEEATITKEVEDLGAVLDAIGERKIGYIGHSMGAAVGVLRQQKDSRIELLVSLAGMVDTRRFAQAEFGDLAPGRDNMWDDENCPLSEAYMNDACHTVGNVLEQAKRVSIPWLLIHGTADDVVLPEDSKAIDALNKPNVSLALIEGGDHSFNEEARQPALDTLSLWIEQHT